MQLVAADGLPRPDLACVDTVGYGGASPPISRPGAARLPGRDARSGLRREGDLSLVAANSAEDMLHRPGSVGVATPACDVRLVDDAGLEAPPGAPGELWVRGPNVVRGYWNDPQATAEAFADGWYRTGDIATRDPEGFITILDRAKDMLIRGGENIYCAEIEAALCAHPGVLEAAVVGVPTRFSGRSWAILHAVPAHPLTTDDLLQHLAPRLAAHKRPVVIQFREAPLPRNAAGKVLKRELKAELIHDQGISA